MKLTAGDLLDLIEGLREQEDRNLRHRVLRPAPLIADCCSKAIGAAAQGSNYVHCPECDHWLVRMPDGWALGHYEERK